ncbi:hypothetical protein J6590_045607 [Homalodisca vitripennis]|nr:hypothetical protein J6590_045607 [Homalodisca vitripennis]
MPSEEFPGWPILKSCGKIADDIGLPGIRATSSSSRAPCRTTSTRSYTVSSELWRCSGHISHHSSMVKSRAIREGSERADATGAGDGGDPEAGRTVITTGEHQTELVTKRSLVMVPTQLEEEEGLRSSPLCPSAAHDGVPPENGDGVGNCILWLKRSQHELAAGESKYQSHPEVDENLCSDWPWRSGLSTHSCADDRSSQHRVRKTTSPSTTYGLSWDAASHPLPYGCTGLHTLGIPSINVSVRGSLPHQDRDIV